MHFDTSGMTSQRRRRFEPPPEQESDAMKPTIPPSMRTAVLSGKNQLTVELRSTPVPGPGEVLIRVKTVGICGSDVHYFTQGRIGDFVVEFPLVLGHEAMGQIVAVGEGVAATRVGERVSIEPQRNCRRCRYCVAGRYNLCTEMRFLATPPVDGALADFIVALSEFAHAVPDSISDDAAALLEPLSVAIAAVRRAGISPGSRVLIAGAGPIGVLCASVSRAFGAKDVVITDLIHSKLAVAETFGATSSIDPSVTDLASLRLGVDAFIDATGAAAAIDSGIRSVGPGGTAVLVGMGATSVPVPIAHLQANEILLTGIFRYTGTWPLAIHLVDSGQVPLDSLVTARYDLHDGLAAFSAEAATHSLKTMIDM